MLVIELSFLSGRYHATPWNRHVNEGAVEWPPSPWRLLRALVATWHRKAANEIEDSVVTRVVQMLAGEPPLYRLPPTGAAHLRHYMPLYRGNTTKVFDAFLDIGRDTTVEVIYPDIELAPELTPSLDLLLERTTYLGRAESWVAARRLPEPSGEPNCWPMSNDPSECRRDETAELVPVLMLRSEDQYRLWREGWLAAETQRVLETARVKAVDKGKDPSKVRLSKAQEQKLKESAPSEVRACLEIDTSEMRKAGWDRPPGSVWVDYRMSVPPGVVAVSPGRRRARQSLPTVARFALSGSVIPQITRAVSVGDRVRAALVARGRDEPVFSGHEPDSTPMTGHRHLHVFSESHDERGRITHVTLYAPMGFNDPARRAIDNLGKVWGEGGHELRMVLLGVGFPSDFAPRPGAVSGSKCELFAEVRSWKSLTPFVPTRHAKTTRRGEPKTDANGIWVGSPEHDLLRLLADLEVPRPTQVDRLGRPTIGMRTSSWLAFQTSRARGHGARVTHVQTGFRLTFAQPVRGPLALGYGSHFGLGLFEPCALREDGE